MRLIVLILIVIIGINCTGEAPKDVIWWNPEFGFLKKGKNNFTHYPMNCVGNSIWESLESKSNGEFILTNVELKGCEMRNGINKTTAIIRESSDSMVILGKSSCFLKTFGDSIFILKNFFKNKNKLQYDSILIRTKIDDLEQRLNIEEGHLAKICSGVENVNLLELTDQLELIFYYKNYFYSRNIQPEIRMKIRLYKDGKLLESIVINKFPCYASELQRCLFEFFFNAKNLEKVTLPIK